MNRLNARVSDAFSREPIRLSTVPNGLGCRRFTHWNRPAVHLDNEHRPLVFVQATGLRDFIIREMTDRKGVTSYGAGGEHERLPGMPHIMQAVSICPVTILPRLAPRDAGQDKCYWRRASGPLHPEIAESTLLGHVRRGPVMIQPIGPLLQTPCEEVGLGGCRFPEDGFTRNAYRYPVDGTRLDALIAAE